MFFCQNLPQFIERAKYKQQKIDHNLYEKKNQKFRTIEDKNWTNLKNEFCKEAFNKL